MTAQLAVELHGGLPDGAIRQMLAVLGDYPDIESVVLFGSRAKGNFRQGSDIDLCLRAPNLSLSDRLQLENRLDDLLLPWNIDLVLWHEIENQALCDHIQRVGISLGPLQA